MVSYETVFVPEIVQIYFIKACHLREIFRIVLNLFLVSPGCRCHVIR